MEYFNKKFSELTVDELYDILQLRAQVFVVEQDCIYQDVDGKDGIANHVFMKENGIIIGYARIFGPEDYFKYASIGRVVVHPDFRGRNLGDLLLERCLKAIYNLYKTTNIEISAQNYLKKFYESHGFEKHGKIYLEDGIEHISMKI